MLTFSEITPAYVNGSNVAAGVSVRAVNLDAVDEIAIAYSDDPSKRAVLIAAALALVTDVVVTTQVHPALLRRTLRLAIPVVLTRPVAGILTRLGV
jgi:hypothetical protein